MSASTIPVADRDPSVLEVGDLARSLGVDLDTGLSGEEVERRRAEVGPNRLADTPTRPAWLRFLDQFRSGIVYILLGAAVLAGAVGDLKDPIVIGVVLVLNAILGYLQEARASSAMAALKRMLVTRVRVRRDGQVQEVDAEELVPGDVVLLEAGDRVPADGRLIVAVNAAVDESALTGESQPVDKQTAPLPPADLPIADRSNLAFMNSTVVRGRIEMLVTATGMRTQMGRVAELLRVAEPPPTPLQRQLDALSHRLALIALVAVSAVLALRLLQGDELADAALGAVALAVAAIPEGLPAVVTVTLALGVSQMAKRGAIIKRLHSVETLGSTSVICTDKTGTLTLNRMTVREVVAEDEGRALLLGALCNDASITDGQSIGEPTEVAILEAAVSRGVDVGAERAQWPRVGEVPFDSAAKFMASFHRPSGAGVVTLVVKGAPDVLVERSALSADERATLEEENRRLAASGLRVLAVGCRALPASEVLDVDGTVADPMRWVEGGLEIVGLFGILDPPRPEAAAAVARCHAAGIDVKMITGDHAWTAKAIAGELGIGGRVVTGAELSAMADVDLARQIDEIGVCARVVPEHKVRVVEALQANGRVVAMTGDGVNDAAALQRADIGVAMGITGTEVTKDAADMVLTDDNFATIVRAVEQGRAIYDNIVKFVRFQLTTNLGAIGTILAASLLGLPVPFTPIQVLWVNLIADGPPAMTLGVDPPGSEVMARAPRPVGAPILDARRVAHLVFLALVMAVGVIGVYLVAEQRWGEGIARSMTFTTFVLFQMFNVFNARREEHSVFSRYSLSNWRLWASVGLVVALQLLAVRWGPLREVFGTEVLTGGQLLLCAATASTVIWADEARKLAIRLIRRSRS
ncbi:MAG: HAD-IC family P-type ATPase [Acidimicrobiales bacterium]